MILQRIIEDIPSKFEMEFPFELKPPATVELVFEFDIDNYEKLNKNHSELFLKGEVVYETPSMNIKSETFSIYFSDIREIPSYEIAILHGDILKRINLKCDSFFCTGDDNAEDLDSMRAKLKILLRENTFELKSILPEHFMELVLKTFKTNDEIGFMNTFRLKDLESKIQLLENHWDVLFDAASKTSFEKTIKYTVRHFLSDENQLLELSDKLGDKMVRMY